MEFNVRSADVILLLDHPTIMWVTVAINSVATAVVLISNLQPNISVKSEASFAIAPLSPIQLIVM